MADKPIGRGTVLAGRFRLEDLVQDTDGARFWRAIDQTLARSVAVSVVDSADPRSDALLVAARTSATITEGHFLRVLDAAQEDGVVYVVHEWGSGMSLDKMLAEGPLPPRRAAWLVKEVADAITFAHSHGIAHGRLVPENVMVTEAGSVKLIGFVVDAVLHGRRQPSTPDGRTLSDHESDVYNLAALLYATLVAKWPGSQECALAEAPRDHDRTLRPRQVRAGVPRALDAICDRVLNPGDDHGSIETAHEIGAALSDFIGDAAGAAPLGPEPTMAIDRDELSRFRPATGAQEPVAGRPSAEEVPTTAAAPVEESPAAQAADPEATQAAPMEGGPAEADAEADAEATRAAAPVFDDESSARRRTPPPPPVLPEPDPRPLFAPGPPRATTPVPGSGGPDDPSGPVRGMNSSHGTGSLPPVWGPDQTPEREDGREWGGRDTSTDWLKLAASLGVVVLLVLAVIFAFNLGRGTGGSPEAGPSEDPAASEQPAAPVQIAGVSDLDPPPSGNGEENSELAPLAIDGDPSTAWQTMTYYGNPRLGLLKDGVGLVVDLGGAQKVSSVQVTLQGGPTNLEVYASPEGTGPPAGVESLRRVAGAKGAGGKTEFTLDEPVTTQYLVVWLTSLPPTDDGYRGRVAEILVRS